MHVLNIHTHSQSSCGYHYLDTRLLTAKGGIQSILIALWNMGSVHTDCLMCQLVLAYKIVLEPMGRALGPY